MLEKKRLVIDTSVLINLIASEDITKILTGLSSEILITEPVWRELKKHPKDNSDCGLLLNSLVEQNLLKPVKNLANTLELYLDLATELGDGEASVIAYTVTQNHCAAVIDEKKARRICWERFSLSPIFCTIDLFQDYFFTMNPNEQEFKQLLFNAIKIGRMRILKTEHEIWVKKILDVDLIQQCSSLKRRSR
jgi:predicted nucleic acid-binding protein